VKQSDHIPVRREAKTPTAIAPAASIAAEPCIIAILQPRTEKGGRQNSNSKQQKFAPGYLEHVSILQGTHQGDLILYWFHPPWVGAGLLGINNFL